MCHTRQSKSPPPCEPQSYEGTKSTFVETWEYPVKRRHTVSGVSCFEGHSPSRPAAMLLVSQSPFLHLQYKSPAIRVLVWPYRSSLLVISFSKKQALRSLLLGQMPQSYVTQPHPD